MIPFVTIELDKVYNLRFGMAAQVEFEQMTGISCMELDENQSITTYAKVLYVMLKRHNKELTFEQVLDLVDEHAPNEGYVIEVVNKAMLAAIGEETKN